MKVELAICVNNDYARNDLRVGAEYRVVKDAEAQKLGQICIIVDDEQRRFPAAWFSVKE